jgi:hypothetical protein
MMKTIKWFGAFAMLGASIVAAVPARALTCWTPSLITPINYQSSRDSYLDCFGSSNLHAEASGSRLINNITRKWTVKATVHNGDQATVWGYDSNRNFISYCFAQRNGVGSAQSAVCSATPFFIQLEAWDNT